MNLPLSFKGLPPQVISKYTRIWIINGVCGNACRTVLKLLQFITQSFTTATLYHAAIVKMSLDKAIIYITQGGRGQTMIDAFYSSNTRCNFRR